MQLKKIVLLAFFCLGILVLILLLFPIAFSATQTNSWWTGFAYYLTESGGKIGTALGIILASYFYTLQEKGIRNKSMVFLKAFIGLAVIIGLFAATNEKFTKPILKLHRPSHEFLLQQMNMPQLIDSLYDLSKEERVYWFGKKTSEQSNLFKQIDPLVIQHWVAEGGYSFPSGHTFNAFLLAMIFGFGILHNTKIVQFQNLFFLPFIWAMGIGISRVAIGAHSLMDVCFGALFGIVFGALLLYLDFTRHWITHKK